MKWKDILYVGIGRKVPSHALRLCARDVIQSSVPNAWKTQSQIALQDEMIGGSAQQRITWDFGA